LDATPVPPPASARRSEFHVSQISRENPSSARFPAFKRFPRPRFSQILVGRGVLTAPPQPWITNHNSIKDGSWGIIFPLMPIFPKCGIKRDYPGLRGITRYLSYHFRSLSDLSALISRFPTCFTRPACHPAPDEPIDLPDWSLDFGPSLDLGSLGIGPSFPACPKFFPKPALTRTYAHLVLSFLLFSAPLLLLYCSFSVRHPQKPRENTRPPARATQYAIRRAHTSPIGRAIRLSTGNQPPAPMLSSGPTTSRFNCQRTRNPP
jgi:hypothetical protein